MSSGILPAWADADLSARLVDLAAGGERQDVEMKEQFPSNAHDLAKEIAAFATSNTGMILIGIADDGKIVGLPACLDTVGRAAVISRIEGLCAGTIKPSITPSCRFAVDGGHVVLVIDVPKGRAPLYYVRNIPYVRQITAARPAEPQEVIDLVLAWHNAGEGTDPESQFLTRLLSLIVDVLVAVGELGERQIKPWLDGVRRDFAYAARRARELAVRPPPSLAEISAPLTTMASDLDKAAHEHLSMSGGWAEMEQAAAAAAEQAKAIRQHWIDSVPVSESSAAHVRNEIKLVSRQLASLASRVEEMEEQGRLDEIQAEAGRLGLPILKYGCYGVGLGDAARLTVLEAIGKKLRDVEARTISMDGGRSVRQIFDDVRSASEDLAAWVEPLDPAA